MRVNVNFKNSNEIHLVSKFAIQKQVILVSCSCSFE